MMQELFFSFELVKYGIISAILLGISLSFTSPFLILRKNSLFPHALTHILFFAIIVVSTFEAKIPDPLVYPVIFIIAMLSASTILLLKYIKFYEDTATAIITHFFLALGLIVAAKTSQYNAKLLSYLFGSVVGLTKKDLYQSVFLLVLTLLLFYKFYPLWVAQTTDESLPGINFKVANFFYLFLLTFQILVGIKIMGILLVSAFFVISGAVALKFSRGFMPTTGITAILNTLAILGGFIFSFLWDLPFSGAVVVFMGLYLVGFSIFRLVAEGK